LGSLGLQPLQTSNFSVVWFKVATNPPGDVWTHSQLPGWWH